MSVVSAISQGGDSGAAQSSQPRASDRSASQAKESNQLGTDGASISCQANERLMAGESVSWGQILREHPMLGQITVTKLVNSGVVQVVPDYDPCTGQIDFQLRKRDADRVVLSPDHEARKQDGSANAASRGPESEFGTARAAERKLRLIRPL
jgi:hypothetical protein